jgi:uncharacterized phage protein (TIGR01671 family)
MSKEIKFKYIWSNPEKTNFITEIFTLDEIEAGNQFMVLENEPLLKNYKLIARVQFTGLLDKNGKEIFKNDIVVLSHPCWSVKCIVKYDEKLACFVLKSFEKIDKGVRKSFLHIYQEDLNYKVIGNIYQNPELIGGENG